VGNDIPKPGGCGRFAETSAKGNASDDLDEASKFLDAVKDTRMSALFIFALTTGMRPQEYLALKWSDN
jgi:integrase